MSQMSRKDPSTFLLKGLDFDVSSFQNFRPYGYSIQEIVKLCWITKYWTIDQGWASYESWMPSGTLEEQQNVSQWAVTILSAQLPPPAVSTLPFFSPVATKKDVEVQQWTQGTVATAALPLAISFLDHSAMLSKKGDDPGDMKNRSVCVCTCVCVCVWQMVAHYSGWKGMWWRVGKIWGSKLGAFCVPEKVFLEWHLRLDLCWSKGFLGRTEDCLLKGWN